MQPRDNKRIKLPEFDGTGNVNGFLAHFKWQVGMVNTGGDVTDSERKSYLVSQLKGTAALWLEGLGEEWIEWEYSKLVQELKNNFEIAQTTHAEKLQALRMRD